MRTRSFLIVSAALALITGAAFIARAESPGPFVEVRDGHFRVGGKRLKLWGSQTGILGQTPAAIDTEVGHFRKLGFNLYRNISVGSAYSMDYQRGDGSTMDLQDYTFAAMAKSGGYNWIDLINNVTITTADADVIDDPEVSRADWLKGMEGKTLRPSALQTVWDLRTQTVYLKHIDRVMNHVNQHTGRRYADEPGIALIELVNEQWWTPNMLAGSGLAELNPAIVRPLLARWNKWLRKKYGDETALRVAWGDLLPGESLRDATILLQPLRGSAALPQMAAVLGINIDLSRNRTIQESTNPTRGSDVFRFLTDVQIDFKTRATQRLRSHARAGGPAAVVPVVRDTGASFSMQSAYENSFGSAYAFGTYATMIDTDRAKPTFPWSMPLAEPPSMGGWMNQNRIENVPGVIYETMTFQPGKVPGRLPAADRRVRDHRRPRCRRLALLQQPRLWPARHAAADVLRIALLAGGRLRRG
jgi:hypothetical protein